MEFQVRAVTRRNIYAIVVGPVVAGAPMIAFNFWLEGLIDRQGEAEVGTVGIRAIALAEARVKDAVGALDGLAARGVNACEPPQVEAMRYPAFSTIPVKEIAIVGPDAGTLCTDLGLPWASARYWATARREITAQILWPTRNPRSSDLTSIYRGVAYTHRYRDVADMKRGGLAAAQVKRHAGGTS